MTILLFVLSCQLLLVEVVSFILPNYHHASFVHHHHGKPSFIHVSVEECTLQPRVRRISILKMSNGILFRGDASSQCLINLPPNSSKSLPEWLRHTDSTNALLGSSNGQQLVVRRKQKGADGPLLWECPQPPLHWFGNEILLTVVNSIDRHEGVVDKVSISIVDARMMHTGRQQQVSRSSARSAEAFLGTLMDQSKLYGGTVLSWNCVDASSWLLSAKLDLTLHVPLPRLLPLPPGFNTLGSNIIKRTCRSRLVSNLEELKEQYAQWAIQ